jgi:AraC-like DNA-binding protein
LGKNPCAARVKQNRKTRKVATLFQLKYAPPPRDLADFVSVFYRFESDEPQMDELERADVAQFRFARTGAGKVVFKNGSVEQIERVAVYGPRTMASRIIAQDPIEMFGFGILPAGWGAMTDISAATVANCIVPAKDIFGAGVDDLTKALAGCATLDDMAEKASDYIRKIAINGDPTSLWFSREVDSWLQKSMVPDFEELLSTTGLPRRRVEILIKQLYGATPNLLIRKYRALRTANLIAHGDGRWQDYAAELYYDQPHCIREIKQFIGITPSAIRDEVSRLTTMTFSRRRLAGEIAPLAAQS